jgi:hypothetical protein
MEDQLAGKPRPILIEKDEFRIFLAARLPSFGGTVQGLAEHLDVTPAAAYALLAGTLQPSDHILEKVGLRTLYVIAATEGDEPAAKPKGKKG